MPGQSVRGGADRAGWARGLEPAIVWREFAGLAAVPRRSKEEGLVRAHVLDRLGEFGLVARADRAGNVVADVPGSSQVATVVLQAHLDMVCEADAGAGTDPAVDGVFPVVADGWVHAPGTTLGADDGIGVAVALAIAAEAASDPVGQERSPRPPLQLLLTVDEEEDFSGAAGVDPQLVTGRILLNLDSEQEHEVIIGGAGGSRVFMRIPTDWQAARVEKEHAVLVVRGLKGGHSGQQIDDNLMNALEALGCTAERCGSCRATIGTPSSRGRTATSPSCSPTGSAVRIACSSATRSSGSATDCHTRTVSCCRPPRPDRPCWKATWSRARWLGKTWSGQPSLPRLGRLAEHPAARPRRPVHGLPVTRFSRPRRG